MRLKSTQMDLKIHENGGILEGPGGHFWRSEASWVRFALPESLGAVSGAVLGGSWTSLCRQNAISTNPYKNHVFTSPLGEDSAFLPCLPPPPPARDSYGLVH